MIDRVRAIENGIRTNRSGPLRKVVGIKPINDLGYFDELLECGHGAGRVTHGEDWARAKVETWIAIGKRRRCELCGRTNQAQSGPGV